jgi:hypothetical protein
VANAAAREELEQIQHHLIGASHVLESKVSRALDLPVGFNLKGAVAFSLQRREESTGAKGEIISG